jgi:hypothetical protein
VWADGYVNGRRTLRVSLETRNLAARKKAAALESPDESVFKAVADSVKGFIEHCQSEGLKDSTISKYRNVLGKLVEFCERIDSLAELRTEKLDQFRAGRGIQPITACKELEILRVFFGFCVDRNWTKENPAKRIKLPRNLKPDDVAPFTAGRRFSKPVAVSERSSMSGCAPVLWSYCCATRHCVSVMLRCSRVTGLALMVGAGGYSFALRRAGNRCSYPFHRT